MSEIDWSNRRLGRWKVIRFLAQSDMSMVYLSQRADGESDYFDGVDLP